MQIDKDFNGFLSKIIEKEKSAWDAFVERYSRIIYNYIFHTLKRYNFYIYDDAVNEIYSRIFISLLENDCRRLKKFRGNNPRSFCAYLREICFNISIDYLREQKYNFIGFETVKFRMTDENSYEELEAFDRKDAIEVIYALTDYLPNRQRHLFNLIYKERLDLKQIAKNMKLKINAIYQLKFRMEQNLNKLFERKSHLLNADCVRQA